jgi:hypothetical protein
VSAGTWSESTAAAPSRTKAGRVWQRCHPGNIVAGCGSCEWRARGAERPIQVHRNHNDPRLFTPPGQCFWPLRAWQSRTALPAAPDQDARIRVSLGTHEHCTAQLIRALFPRACASYSCWVGALSLVRRPALDRIVSRSKQLSRPNLPDNTPPISLQPSAPRLMTSMNARLKNLVGGSKRKSSAGNPSQSPQGAVTPTGQQRPTSLSPQASNSSSASLPMNPQNPQGRPPSYTFAPSGAPNPQPGRPASPLPPINTGASGGYPPQQQPMGYPPQGPPGYPPQGPPPGQYGGGQYGAPPNPGAPHGQQVQQQYRPPGMAEVAGEGRSKAQLIVGIDFVSGGL